MIKNNKGFTLIELLVTMSIIIVIAAISVPGLLSYQEKQNEDRLINAFISQFRNYQQLALSKDSDMKIEVTNSTKISFCDSTKCETLSSSSTLFNQNLTFYINKYGDILNSSQTSITNDLILESSNYKLTINKYGGISKQNK